MGNVWGQVTTSMSPSYLPSNSRLVSPTTKPSWTTTEAGLEFDMNWLWLLCLFPLCCLCLALPVLSVINMLTGKNKKKEKKKTGEREYSADGSYVEEVDVANVPVMSQSTQYVGVPVQTTP